MAQYSSSSKVFTLVLAIFMAVALVSAQDFGTAQSPAPSPDAGAAFSLPVSVVAVASSLVFSLLALS
ncbi:hypothetical protein FNV43_RR16502 [Rhamnella rubrinervis]|uniref:Uncharacterized protein n=1 Tax=Rhamnella rubrinervis TaxID=2594499 RepID=A0A8K0GYY4_9ROSA|nr:hypothetical protein FNV43_RR16502 [Rhamnella rubrinervis]